MFDEYSDDMPDGTESVRPQYKAFLAYLSSYPRLSPSQQASATHERLWIESLRIVLYVFHLMRRTGQLIAAPDDMDMIQEGALAAGRAVKRWNPEKGTLSTFLVPAIRGAMLSYAAQERKQMPGVIQMQAIVAEIGDDEWTEPEELSLDETLEYPYAVFLSPERSAYYAQVIDRVQRMPADSRRMLEAFFFMDQSVKEIADREGKSVATVHRKIAWALNERFWKKFRY